MNQSQAMSILKSGSSVFLTGEPGSGKTYITNEYVAYLRAQNIDVAITASTGIAATHIGGRTIHSWSGIGVKNKLDKHDLDYIAKSKYVGKSVRRAQVLIIEEISMLSAQTLSLVDAVCRKLRKNPMPFGGLQVVFVGDFFQLPPIVKHETIQTAQLALIQEQTARFAYDAAVWKQLQPTICYLTEQHRQDDKGYLGILSAIRKNAFNDTHLHMLQKRKVEHGGAPNDVPKLFSHNRDVDRVNDEVLEKLTGKQCVFTMTSHGHDALVATLQKSCLSPSELHLKTGAVVMFTKNNQKEGFVNGTLGTVVSFDTHTKYPSVRTRDGRLIDVEPMDWVVEEGGEIHARITQIPLRLAWAITVHKSQGMSMDAAAVDLTSVFEFGQGYVALSRLRRLAGLYLLGWNERAFQVHPEVLAQDGWFRSQSEITEKTLDISVRSCSMNVAQENDDVSKKSSLKIRKAYQSWDEEQDTELRELYLGGASIADIAKEFSRTPGSIRSRLTKYSLLITK